MSRISRSNVAFYDRFATEYDLFFHDLRENMAQEGEWEAGFQRVERLDHPSEVVYLLRPGPD